MTQAISGTFSLLTELGKRRPLALAAVLCTAIAAFVVVRWIDKQAAFVCPPCEEANCEDVENEWRAKADVCIEAIVECEIEERTCRTELDRCRDLLDEAEGSF